MPAGFDKRTQQRTQKPRFEPRFDRALRAARSEGKRASVMLATDVTMHYESATRNDTPVRAQRLTGEVKDVDVYTILLSLTEPQALAGREVWVSKSMIVCTEIL